MYSTISIYFISSQVKYILPFISEIILEPTYPNKVIQDRILNKKKAFIIALERSSEESRRQIKKLLYGNKHPYGKILLEQNK